MNVRVCFVIYRNWIQGNHVINTLVINFNRSLWGEGHAISRFPSICPKFHLHLQQYLSSSIVDWAREAAGLQQIFVRTHFQWVKSWLNCFSVNKLVEDVEKSFLKNINSQEKVDSLPQVLNDFFLLRKFYVKFQSSPQSLIQTGIISIKYECFWLTSLLLFSTWYQTPILTVGPRCICGWLNKFYGLKKCHNHGCEHLTNNSVGSKNSRFRKR